MVPYRVVLKDERRTSNAQRWTSNNDVAPLRNLVSFVCKYLMSNLEWLFLLFSDLRLRSGPWACRTAALNLVANILINSSVSSKISFSSSFPIQHSTFDLLFFNKPSAPQPTTPNPQPPTRNPQPATPNPQPTTHNPQLLTRIPQPLNLPSFLHDPNVSFHTGSRRLV